MKRAIAILAGVFLLLGFSIPWAQAITIIKSALGKRLGENVVRVVGKGAAPNATILWEGAAVATAGGRGRFRFTTEVVPSDCLGELSDGVTTVQVGVGGCTMTETGGGVLATGQTTCYDSAGNVIACAGTGQDGELQEGTARSYTDNGDGTITDNATGLMWEKLTDDSSIHDWDNTYTWANAFQKIADLNTANFAGHNDWRLPNINELQSLADYGQFNPAIDPAFNSGDSFTQSSGYWSSTTLQASPATAWIVGFRFGSVVNAGKTGGLFVRAVRGP